MDKDALIYVAGHKGLVGSAVVRRLNAEGHHNILTRTHGDLDLKNQCEVDDFFAENPIDYVILAAAKVGGIHANNTYSADFAYNNLMIAANVINASARSQVKKLLFLGSSCIYPKSAVTPIREESILSGPLEPTNEGYAIAKLAGIKLCQMYQKQYGKFFISALPCNIYGPGDNFDLENSHVLPGMMRKFHDAKVRRSEGVTLWGTGMPLRELLHVDDLARGLYLLMQEYVSAQPINIGAGVDIRIKDLAELIRMVIGFEGDVIYDAARPDGTYRKVLNVSRMNYLGWQPSISLIDGIRETYKWAIDNEVLKFPD